MVHYMYVQKHSGSEMQVIIMLQYISGHYWNRPCIQGSVEDRSRIEEVEEVMLTAFKQAKVESDGVVTWKDTSHDTNLASNEWQISKIMSLTLWGTRKKALQGLKAFCRHCPCLKHSGFFSKH